MTYLLDTSSIIDLMRKHGKVETFIEKHRHDTFVTSSICAYELWCGVGGHTERLQDVFQAFSTVISFSSEQARAAGSLYESLAKQGTLIDDVDILIAAAAIEHHATLITGNVKHFSRIPNLEVLTIS